MSGKTIRRNRASISCSFKTREKVRSLKHSNQTYDDLLRQMVKQYDLDTDRDPEGRR